MILGVDPNSVNVNLHPIAFAGWIGLLVTTLNLLPVGQLDGGHVVYALFGRWHRTISRLFIVACVLMVVIPLFMGSAYWGGWLFWVVLLFFLGLGHPATVDADTPLDPRRRAFAWATIALFIVTFSPVPAWYAQGNPNQPEQPPKDNTYSVFTSRRCRGCPPPCGLRDSEMSGGGKRPSWDQYFMTITQQVAERSTCLRAKVGAVIVRDRSILATGYNGSPAGLPHCIEVGCLIYESRTPDGEIEQNCYRTIHAEINAITQAAKNGAAIRDADIYVTHTPCIHCLKVLINTGMRTVYYGREYKLHTVSELLKHAAVKLVQVTPENADAPA